MESSGGLFRKHIFWFDAVAMIYRSGVRTRKRRSFQVLQAKSLFEGARYLFENK
jgi:hypothetical protein